METVIPYLIVKGAANALAHGEMVIGESKIFVADENPELGIVGPQGRSPVTLVLNTDDCDAVFHRAIAAGGTVEREPKTQFYGDRTAGVIDPFGHTWYLSTHVEDVSEEEMKRRLEAMKD